VTKSSLWGLVVLEILFGLCATSVVIYQVTGRFDFGFGFLSYRFFNIAISVLLVGYIIYGLFKAHKNILLLVSIFSLFHFVEGVFIQFWFKVVIHFLILLICGHYYLKSKTLHLEKSV